MGWKGKGRQARQAHTYRAARRNAKLEERREAKRLEKLKRQLMNHLSYLPEEGVVVTNVPSVAEIADFTANADGATPAMVPKPASTIRRRI